MLGGLRRLLILLHRYLGIPLSFLFVVWFASGIAMIYVGGMPALSPAERLEHLSPLDLGAIRINPADAARRAQDDSPADVKVLTVLGRPAYRIDGVTVFADDGETLAPLDRAAARTVAARFVGASEEQVQFVRTVERPDQWTLLLGRELPLEKFAIEDGRGTEVYVSPETAEVALKTTARTRAFAWIATIPHWFYFTDLRTNQRLWYRTVVWASELGCVLAALGLVLGVVQFRKSKPFSFARSIRYQGWMRWHYILGAFFGVFALTWVFSGLLSMEPFAWTNAEGLRVPRDAFTGGELELARFDAFDARAWDALRAGRSLKEIELKRIQDEPFYVAHYSSGPVAAGAKRERLHQPYDIAGRAQPESELVDARTLAARREPFSIESLRSRLEAAVPGTAIVAQDVLADYDSYYYSRNREAPLPVLRVKFADPLETWVYVDPKTSALLASVHRLSRLERWLYNGLHSLDFSFWYSRRPLWDIGMILLCAGALASSIIGLCLGVKRLGRDIARLVRSRTPVQPQRAESVHN
ncbi:MAG TPA: PepSY domain-containing protein [Gammaproteobacteria bacterium]|nr:PepSY domain-containing protein [Gammaproteobacteria bacterium]